MKQFAAYVAAALGAAFLFPGSAPADPIVHLLIGIPCSSPEEIDGMISKFGEKRLAVATDPAGMIELRVNETTGTYTLLLTTTDGLTCVLAAGRKFTAPGLTSAPGLPL